jgi:hypothetical protein
MLGGVLMRLDAMKGDSGWFVWHCRLMKTVDLVIWVDDFLAQYGAWPDRTTLEAALLSGKLSSPPVHQADRIAIITTKRLILIDPIGEQEQDFEEISRPMPLECS